MKYMGSLSKQLTTLKEHGLELLKEGIIIEIGEWRLLPYLDVQYIDLIWNDKSTGLRYLTQEGLENALWDIETEVIDEKEFIDHG